MRNRMENEMNEAPTLLTLLAQNDAGTMGKADQDSNRLQEIFHSDALSTYTSARHSPGIFRNKSATINHSIHHFPLLPPISQINHCILLSTMILFAAPKSLTHLIPDAVSLCSTYPALLSPPRIYLHPSSTKKETTSI